MMLILTTGSRTIGGASLIILILFILSKVVELLQKLLRELAMTTEVVTTIGKDLLQTTFLLMAPMLIVAMVVGLVIGIFQAVSSIHEQTITFLPKVFGVLGVFLFCLPWMMRMMTSYTVNLLGNLTRYCQ